MPRRCRYTEEEILAALKANNWNLTRTAGQLGVSFRYLRKVRDGYRAELEEGGASGSPYPPPPTPTDEALADRLRELASKLISRLDDPSTLQRASVRDIGILLGITLDKISNLTPTGPAADAGLVSLVEAIKSARERGAEKEEKENE